MAKGAPDWTSPITIALQTLAEIIMRNKLGASQYDGSTSAATANDTKTYLFVTGTGAVSLALFTVDGTAIQKGDEPQLEIDGNTLGGISFDAMNKYVFNKPYAAIVNYNNYDDTLFLYSAVFPQLFTFESSFKLKYKETHGRTPTIVAEAWYAVI